MLTRTTSCLVLAVFVGAISVASGSLAATTPVGDPAEQFTLKVVNVETVDKRIYSLGHLVGEGATDPKKVVIISFFATYCEPCKRELPFLEKLYQRYSDKGLGIMVVSIDKDKEVPGGAAKAIGDLATAHKLTYPVLHDRFNIVAKRYAVEKLPCLYLVDGAGKVAMVNVGYTDDFSDQLAMEIQKRLGVPVEKIEHAEVDKKAKKKKGKKKTSG